MKQSHFLGEQLATQFQFVLRETVWMESLHKSTLGILIMVR